jgi:hypothetical protein
MIPDKALYWGDNDAHEFWESEDHELLILRNHQESFWTVHRNYGYLFGAKLTPKLPKDSMWFCRPHGDGCNGAASSSLRR